MSLKFIAEISGNHGGSFTKALQLVRLAAEAGVTHLKLQTYTPDSLTLDLDTKPFRVGAEHLLWSGRTLHSLYSLAQTPKSWHGPIFSLSRELGMEPFSTPFDEASADFLENHGVNLYKVASMEIVDLPLISHIARKGKPMILSTGTASEKEVEDAVEAARLAGCVDLTILVCTSDYPAQASQANLARIPYLKEKFRCEVGLSDHTIGTHVAMAAIALGASVVEKHICLSRNDGAIDSGFSATPEELVRLVRDGTEVASSIGTSRAWGLSGESQSRSHRPSIIVTRDVAKGEVFSEQNVATLRPNIGLPPKYLPKILGSKSLKSLSRGTGVTAEAVENFCH